MSNLYCVVTFHSVYHALNFEKIIRANKISVSLMPVPRQVSTSCGTAAEIPCQQRQEIVDICTEHHIEIAEIHQIENPKKNNWFMKFMNRSV